MKNTTEETEYPHFRVRTRTLPAIAGCVWLAAGINVARLGILSYGKSRTITPIHILLSLIVFGIFGIMFFYELFHTNPSLSFDIFKNIFMVNVCLPEILQPLTWKIRALGAAGNAVFCSAAQILNPSGHSVQYGSVRPDRQPPQSLGLSVRTDLTYLPSNPLCLSYH